MIERILIAGFGGQGVMLSGELLANAAMIEGKQVTYMPSYGPEMRGGTANCSVIISDYEISSPIITAPTMLIAMNEPSLDKFEDIICPNGLVFINKSIINRSVKREDIKSFTVNCNELAQSISSEKIANIVMIGAAISATGIVKADSIKAAMERKFTGNKAKFIPMNMKALSAWNKSIGGVQ